MASDRPRFSVIIATCNRPDELAVVLESVRAQTYKGPVEIVVVDQSEGARFAKPHSRVPGTKVILTSQKGLSRSRNLGIEQAEGEFLVFVDDDAVLEHDYLTKVDLLIQTRANSVAFCGMIRNIEDHEPFSRYMGDKEGPVNTQNFHKCLSSAMTIQSSVLRHVGLFDERFGLGSLFAGSEETDVVLRLLWDGHKVYYSPQPTVYHPRFDASQLENDVLARKSFGHGRGRGALFRKHFRRRPLWAAFQFSLAIMMSAYGLVSAIIRLDTKGCVRYASTVAGRLQGFVTYR